MQQWFEIQLDAPESLREPIINRLFELGAAGVNEPHGAELLIRGFFDESQRDLVDRELPAYLSSLGELYPELPKVGVRVVAVQHENWAERHKDFYKAQ